NENHIICILLILRYRRVGTICGRGFIFELRAGGFVGSFACATCVAASDGARTQSAGIFRVQLCSRGETAVGSGAANHTYASRRYGTPPATSARPRAN